MAFYDQEIIVATTLISDFGKDVTLRRYTDAAAPDPNRPWLKGSRSSSDTVVKAVLLQFSEKDIDGTLVLMGDKKALIAGSSLTTRPTNRDKLIDGSDEWSIISVQTLSPNGQEILYAAKLRK